jgi:hypothetical protein
MAESKFMAFLKNLFGGGVKAPQHERFCMGCRKITSGSICAGEGTAATAAGSGPCVLFTCGECKHTTALLA